MPMGSREESNESRNAASIEQGKRDLVPKVRYETRTCGTAKAESEIAATEGPRWRDAA
jgi:hypothetical protein